MYQSNANLTSGTQRGSIASTLSGTLRKPSGSTLISLAGMLAERDSQQLSAAMATGSAQSVRERRSSRGSSEDQRLQPSSEASRGVSQRSPRDNRNSLGSAVLDNNNSSTSSIANRHRSSQSTAQRSNSNSSNNDEERRCLRERNRRRERERRDRMDRFDSHDYDHNSAHKSDVPLGKTQVDQRVKVIDLTFNSNELNVRIKQVQLFIFQIVDTNQVYDTINLGRRIDVIWPSSTIRARGGKSYWKSWLPESGMEGLVRITNFLF